MLSSQALNVGRSLGQSLGIQTWRNSAVRGYHVYKVVWKPTIGEKLLVDQELGNEADKFAVKVVRNNEISRQFTSRVLQYCAKVMQAKCANFVLCSRDFLMKVRLKVRMKFHGISSDNSLEQRAIFLRTFVQLKKIREHKR